MKPASIILSVSLLAFGIWAALADSEFIDIRCSPTAPYTNYVVQPGKVAFIADYFGPPYLQSNPDLYALHVRYTREEGTAFSEAMIGSYLVGPCSVIMSWQQQVDFNIGVYWATLKIMDAKEASASPDQTLVIPRGLGATVRLQASTDLKAWRSVTETNYLPTATNQFFRVKVDLQN